MNIEALIIRSLDILISIQTMNWFEEKSVEHLNLTMVLSIKKKEKEILDGMVPHFSDLAKSMKSIKKE